MVRAVLKSYRKNILREMKDNLSRMVSLFGIVALGVMMLTGLMSFAPSMRIAGQKYYVQQNVFDLRVLSTLGLSEDDITAIAAVDGVEAVQAVKYQDVEAQWQGQSETAVVRLQQLPADPGADTAENMDRLVLLSGRMPEAPDECVVHVMGYGDPVEPGTVLTLPEDTEHVSRKQFTVVGTVQDPQHFSTDKESSTAGDGQLDDIVFLPEGSLTTEYYTACYLKVKNAGLYDNYSDEYQAAVDDTAARVKAISGAQCTARRAELIEDASAELADARAEYNDKKAEADRQFAEAEQQLADAQGWPTFVVPDDVGGRYSVLSAVGLLPIAAAGIDIDALMQGAADAMERFSVLSPDNDAYKYAAIRNILYRKGKSVEILECYEPDFTLMNEWYKQLFGESEGKDNKGLFPASCIFSTDLHSMGQFIQEGSRTMFETIVDVKKPAQDLFIDKLEGNFDGLNFLADQNMSVVNRKAMEGTILAHTDGGVPEVLIEVDDLSAYNVGYLIYFFWRACACSGYLLSVNPFNQPGVESYKKNMFALLGKPGYENLTAELEAKLK